MAKTLMELTIIVALVAIFIVGREFHGAQAAVYVVGNSVGWQNPPNTTYYQNWASTINFNTGDVLTFSFPTGVHDVATATQNAYTNCATSNTNNVINNGPANVTLYTSGMYYFFCTFPNHCNVGQKLSINVNGNNLTAPNSPPPPPNGPPPPPPPPYSASSTVAANVALIMFMYIAAFFM